VQLKANCKPGNGESCLNLATWGQIVRIEVQGQLGKIFPDTLSQKYLTHTHRHIDTHTLTHIHIHTHTDRHGRETALQV
jgi:hypothetical protein